MRFILKNHLTQMMKWFYFQDIILKGLVSKVLFSKFEFQHLSLNNLFDFDFTNHFIQGLG